MIEKFFDPKFSKNFGQKWKKSKIWKSEILKSELKKSRKKVEEQKRFFLDHIFSTFFDVFRFSIDFSEIFDFSSGRATGVEDYIV